ncbi:hypothetical protein ADL28_31400 [Streptomyces violaceusniger]|uniref:Uncharacterized protein n=1 Tax=Streptomyces violaceusniger TaxID=68280 RepID=A0A0X3VSX0_STRVO|nr:hypothetical protein ADL28_31400 [Streptomyces violaceusniger]
MPRCVMNILVLRRIQVFLVRYQQTGEKHLGEVCRPGFWNGGTLYEAHDRDGQRCHTGQVTGQPTREGGREAHEFVQSLLR